MIQNYFDNVKRILESLILNARVGRARARAFTENNLET